MQWINDIWKVSWDTIQFLTNRFSLDRKHISIFWRNWKYRSDIVIWQLGVTARLIEPSMEWHWKWKYIYSQSPLAAYFNESITRIYPYNYPIYISHRWFEATFIDLHDVCILHTVLEWNTFIFHKFGQYSPPIFAQHVYDTLHCKYRLTWTVSINSQLVHSLWFWHQKCMKISERWGSRRFRRWSSHQFLIISVPWVNLILKIRIARLCGMCLPAARLF